MASLCTAHRLQFLHFARDVRLVQRSAHLPGRGSALLMYTDAHMPPEPECIVVLCWLLCWWHVPYARCTDIGCRRYERFETSISKLFFFKIDLTIANSLFPVDVVRDEAITLC